MGFDAASMNDITREAGVSKGTIYVYFNSKEDLFVALCEHYRDTMFRELIEKLDKGFNSRQQLTDFGVALVTLITSPTAVRAQRIVLGVSERKPELAARFYERGPKRSLVLMAEYLDDMIKNGELEPFDPEKMAYQLSDLFLSGLYRPRLFGVLPEPPSAETIRKTLSSPSTFSTVPMARSSEVFKREQLILQIDLENFIFRSINKFCLRAIIYALFLCVKDCNPLIAGCQRLHFYVTYKRLKSSRDTIR